MRLQLGVLAVATTMATAIGVLLPSGVAQAQTSGNESGTLIQTSPTGPQHVYLAGPIVASGIDNQVSDTEDVFVFPNGTMTVDHATESVSVDKFDPTSCVFVHRETDTFETTGGTGAYSGVEWSGTATVKVTGRGCDPNGEPSLLVVVINASGPISTSSGG